MWRGWVTAAAVLWAGGCGDEIVNNYYSSVTSGIVGRVVPADTGMVVAIAADSFASVIDPTGSFVIDALAPGVYRLSVRPANHTRRELRGIVVPPGGTKSVIIALSSHPYPIYDVYPGGGTGLDLKVPIRILTDELLNLDDLQSGTQIQPPLAGQWQSPQTPQASLPGLMDAGSFIYSFDHPPLLPDTTYEVTIDSAVRTAGGAALGTDVVFRFDTRSEPEQRLRSYFGQLDEGVSGGISISSFPLQISFNACVRLDSLMHAVVISPSVPGVWVAASACRWWDYECDSALEGAARDGDLFRFFATDQWPLQPETQYAVTISDRTTLTPCARLAAPETLQFVTEPYGVTAVSPRMGDYLPVWAPVSLQFNAPMDTASVESLFVLEEVDGDAVAGSYAWTRTTAVKFDPDNDLRVGAIYRIFLSHDARRATGDTLKNDFESYFSAYQY